MSSAGGLSQHQDTKEAKPYGGEKGEERFQTRRGAEETREGGSGADECCLGQKMVQMVLFKVRERLSIAGLLTERRRS